VKLTQKFLYDKNIVPILCHWVSSYHKQKYFIENVEAKLPKQGKQISPIGNKDGDHVMSNPHSESDRHIHSFNQIVKRKYKTLTIYFVKEYSIDFQCKRVRNEHIKNKYHIFEKWIMWQRVYINDSLINMSTLVCYVNVKSY